ncbi:MAG: hypothetical protein LUQ28_14725 [Methylococcaceae bacterium]|nr:hypothetical protein [Methylococcaceae bacterium]
MQQQIEFETIPVQHTIRIPDTVPDGVSVRITLSFDDEKINLTDSVLDQTRVHVDQKTYNHFLEVLDLPPSGEGFARLMAASKPWNP